MKKWNTWVRREKNRDDDDDDDKMQSFESEKKTLHNQAFLFMFSKIREIVLRLFLFYFIWIEMKRTSEQQAKNSQKNGLFHFSFFFFSECERCFFFLFFHHFIYDNMACPVVHFYHSIYAKLEPQHSSRQTSGNKIKMPFSIHIHTYIRTYPLLCKMNFISIIIINVVHGGG